MNQHSRHVEISRSLRRTGAKSALTAGMLVAVWSAVSACGQQTIGEKVDAILAAEVSSIGTYFPRSAKLELSDGTIVFCPWSGSSAGHPIHPYRLRVFQSFLNLSDSQIDDLVELSRRSTERFWLCVRNARKDDSPGEERFRFIQEEKKRVANELRSLLRQMQFRKSQSAVFRMMAYWDGLVGMLVDAPRAKGLQSTPIGKALGIRPRQIERLCRVRKEFQNKWKKMTVEGWDSREDRLAFEREFVHRVLQTLDVDQRAVLEYWLDLSAGLTRPSRDRLVLLLNLRDASDADALPGPKGFFGPLQTRLTSTFYEMGDAQ